MDVAVTGVEREGGPTVAGLVRHALSGVAHATVEDRRKAARQTREAALAAHSLPERLPAPEMVYGRAIGPALAAAGAKRADMASPTPTEEPLDGEIGAAVRVALAEYERAAGEPAAFGAETLPEAQIPFFRRCIGGDAHHPAVHGANVASHPVTVNAAYEEAKGSCPVAADVIAALVWRLSILQNNNAFAWQAALATKDESGGQD